MKDNIVVLAAGKSTRMKMNVNKCTIPVLGKPMIRHLFDTFSELNIKNKVVVLGFQAEKVKEIVGEEAVYAFQDEQLGTGHAVLCAVDKLDKNEELTFIICGDMPLLKKETLNTLRDYHLKEENIITVVSTIVDDPKRYGRMIKDSSSKLLKIVEFKDANDDEKKINEINTGVYCVNTNILPLLLKKVSNRNAKKEYYLTDIISIANQDNLKVGVYLNKDSFQFSGIDDIETLNDVEFKLKQNL